ncbi:MAG: hypothetical protein ACKPGI_00555, partial [Verrucomicrobiota bacterium]
MKKSLLSPRRSKSSTRIPSARISVRSSRSSKAVSKRPVKVASVPSKPQIEVARGVVDAASASAP